MCASESSHLLYADVVVQIDVAGLPQPLTYAVPPALSLAVGDAVLMPFGAQTAAGYVIGLKNNFTVTGRRELGLRKEYRARCFPCRPGHRYAGRR